MLDLAALDPSALLPFILIGFAAQLVDGALGMAFGVICNTLLVAVMGVPPATASARIHVVEVFTTAVSGISHLLHRNIEWPLFWKLLIPGVTGGVLGAYVLTSLHADAVKPFVLAYLVAIGIWLLVRGLLYPPKVQKPTVIAPLGLVGGFLDAAGGGWGPVVTSNLLVQGAEPRKVVGTVNSVEFFLTLAVSATFIFNLGFADVAGATLGLLIGGVIAAPIGAVMAKRFSVKLMLTLVGVVLT
ncbi:MAG: sulfite exporter TauE/SafE family protein, partial [Sphingopyxis sp.]